ncbi:unnamed protein product [Sphagnum balticum]
MVNPPPSALWVAIIITQMWCTGAVFCCCLFTSIIVTELAEGTTMILFQERCLSFMRVAKRTNKQSIQGMDLAHIMELNFMVQNFCSMDVMCISATSFFSWV